MPRISQKQSREDIWRKKLQASVWRTWRCWQVASGSSKRTFIGEKWIQFVLQMLLATAQGQWFYEYVTYHACTLINVISLGAEVAQFGFRKIAVERFFPLYAPGKTLLLTIHLLIRSFWTWFTITQPIYITAALLLLAICDEALCVGRVTIATPYHPKYVIPSQ